MKFKLLLAILLFPFVSMAANTNVFDNVIIRNSLIIPANINSPLRQGFGASGQLSIDWGDMILYDSSAQDSIGWGDRNLIAIDGTDRLDWQNRILYGNWTVEGSLIVTNGLTVSSGLINGKNLSNFITNITSASVTVTGQGTSTINIESAGAAGPFAVTNGNNTFTIASTNRFSAPTFTSNLFVTGSILVNSNLFTPAQPYHSVHFFPAIGQTDNSLKIYSTGAGGEPAIDVIRGNGKGITMKMSGDIGRVTLTGGATAMDFFASGSITLESPSIIFGSVSSDTRTYIGKTETRPNGWLVNGFAPATVIVTNVTANFPSILAASFADLTFPVSNTSSNMVVSVGNPTSEDSALSVNAFVSAIGTVTLRARNVGTLAVDQGDLPYRLQVTVSPTANSP